MILYAVQNSWLWWLTSKLLNPLAWSETNSSLRVGKGKISSDRIFLNRIQEYLVLNICSVKFFSLPATYTY